MPLSSTHFTRPDREQGQQMPHLSSCHCQSSVFRVPDQHGPVP